jgi:thioredoxin reductase (NADPH)
MPVAVIGGNNEAVDEALFLTKFASKVTIIHRADKLRADKIRLEKAEASPKIEYMMNTSVLEVLGKDKVTGLIVKDLQTEETKELPFDAVFVFIGQKPVSELYEGQLEMEKGLIKVDERMHTNIPGVYAAGESVDGIYKQVAVSVGSGVMAAMSLSKDLA